MHASTLLLASVSGCGLPSRWGVYCDIGGHSPFRRTRTSAIRAYPLHTLLAYLQSGFCMNSKLTATHRIEMNVIIIAACIPTLRPLCLVIFNRPDADAYRPSVNKRSHSSYYKTPKSTDSSQSQSILSNKVFGKQANESPNESTKSIFKKNYTMAAKDLRVGSREVGSRDGDIEEEEWVHATGSGVPMSGLGQARDEVDER